MAAKLLETQAGGKPIVVFIAGANKGWDEYILTSTETKLLYADSVANGANPWYGIPSYLADRPGALAAREMNNFISKNTQFLGETVPLAGVALFWSSMSADYYRASTPVTDFTPQGERLEKRRLAGDFYKSFLGCYEALVRSHVPFCVLDEEALTPEILSGYGLLVAPGCACISDSKAQVISDYVKAGGNLVASFETSRYNEYGDLRKDFRLASTLGVRIGKGTFGPMRIDYMTVTDSHPSTEGLSARLIPSPTYGVEVISTTSRALVMYHEKMPSRYAKVPPVSRNPALLVNKYGKGNCLYVAGNFFEHYYNYHNPDYRRIVANAASWMSKKLVTLKNCPRSVEVTLRHQPTKSKLMIHLINFTAEMTRPMESITPISNINITLHNLTGLKEAKVLWTNKNIDLLEANKDHTFTLPVLHEYEVIAVEPFTKAP